MQKNRSIIIIIFIRVVGEPRTRPVSMFGTVNKQSRKLSSPNVLRSTVFWEEGTTSYVTSYGTCSLLLVVASYYNYSTIGRKSLQNKFWVFYYYY